MPSRTARSPRIVRLRAVEVAAVCALAACAAMAPRRAVAQRVPPPALSTSGPAVGPYERARRLVEQGQGALGRAVADSLVAASPPGSPALAEALWWRATLSADGARAEQDLRRIVDEFSSSPRVGDATVRIAQLDLARDRPDMAEPTLARLVRERPDDPARAQAAYWLARARLELGDTRGGCVALADAATWARSSETFTRQQVSELRGRLPACDPASVVSVMGSAPRTVVASTPAPAPASTPTSPPISTPAPGAAPAPRSAPPPSTPAASVASATPTAPVSAQRIDSLEAAELRHRNAVLTDTRRAAATTSPTSRPVASSTPSSTPGAAVTRAASPAVSTTGSVTPSVMPSVTPSVMPSVTASAAADAKGNPSPAPAPTRVVSAAPATPPPTASDAAGAFAVQVAAYNQRDGAESLANRLRARGIDARATGQVAPFRVKIGRYPTRAAAAAARATFAGQGLAGFVTDAGDGPAAAGRP